MADEKKVLVRNERGQLGEIPISQIKDALREGFTLASPDEAKERALQREYGEGFGTEARAFGEAAARGVTLGLSDAALRALGADAEGLRERRERNPIAATTGEIAGVAAPLVASSLAGPAGPAGVIGSLAARTPVGLVARGSTALGEAGAAALQGTKAAKILGQSAAPALGSAIEGAAYGLGASVSEEMLGQSGLSAESVLTNVGLGGLFGGVLGGAFSRIARATPETILDDVIRDITPPPSPTSLKETAEAAGIDASYVKGLGKKRAGAAAIEAAADEIGAPVAPGMVGGKEVQKLSDIIRNSSSAPARAHAKIYDNGFEIAEKVVGDALGESSGMSLAQVGEALKDGIVNNFVKKIAPTQAIYNELGDSMKNIIVPDKTRLRIAKNIRNIVKEDEIFDQQARSFIDLIASRLDEASSLSLDGVKKIQTGINQAAKANPALWKVGGLIDDRLEHLRYRILAKTAQEMPPGEARSLTRSLLKMKRQADTEYRALRKEMDELGSALFGHKRINGPQHFLHLLDQTNPERFAEKLFTKKNAKHLAFMAKFFPEETRLLARYQKDKILQSAGLRKGSMARMNSIFRAIDQMEPEARAFVFTPEEIKKITAAKTYLRAFPESFNTSRTAHAMDTLQFWSSPMSAAGITARDFTIVQAIKGLGPKTSAKAQQEVKVLSRLERFMRTTGEGIEKSAKAIIHGTRSGYKAGRAAVKGLPYGAMGAAGASELKRKDEKDTLKLINDLSGDPERLIEKLDKSTQIFSEFAPKIAASIGMTAVTAIEFLASKAPQRPNMGPLASEYEFSPYEISKFNRYADVVDDPLVVLEQIETATITPEAIETIQTVYPGLYQEMKLSLLNELTESPDAAEKMPYAKKMALSLFMQEDLMASISGPQIMSNQMAYQKPPQQQASAMMGGGASKVPVTAKLSFSNQMKTPLQKTAERGVSGNV